MMVLMICVCYAGLAGQAVTYGLNKLTETVLQQYISNKFSLFGDYEICERIIVTYYRRQYIYRFFAVIFGLRLGTEGGGRELACKEDK